MPCLWARNTRNEGKRESNSAAHLLCVFVRHIPLVDALQSKRQRIRRLEKSRVILKQDQPPESCLRRRGGVQRKAGIHTSPQTLHALQRPPPTINPHRDNTGTPLQECPPLLKIPAVHPRNIYDARCLTRRTSCEWSSYPAWP